jgi:hypothetical protein
MWLKRKRDRETDLEIGGVVELTGGCLFFLSDHGSVGLDRVEGHTRGLAKPHESGVYDGGRVHDLPHARGTRIPCSGRGTHHGMHDVLRARIWCSSTPISPLFAVVLCLGTASLDCLGDLTHGSLGDPV